MTGERATRQPVMRRLATLVIAAASAGALVLGWGYWHAVTHASLQIHVDDVGLRSSSQAYGTPHNVTVTFRDRTNVALAVARSIEPAGYLLAVHPDADVGTCEHRASRGEYSSCYEQYSAWSAGWAPYVHSADVSIGGCSLRGVPVATSVTNSEWPLWWVPLPHVGGVPRQDFDFTMAVDSRSCVAVVRGGSL
jgi:hypothetical protein